MNKDEALAICLSYLNGPRDKDLLTTARALHYLRSLPEYSSNIRVGAAVGVSGETVREFLTILRLPEAVQVSVRSLEHGRRLWQLGRKRPDILPEAADILAPLLAHDARHVVDYLLRNAGSTVAEAKDAVLSAKTVVERVFHIVAELGEDDYRALRHAAGQAELNVNALVTTITVEWLKQH